MLGPVDPELFFNPDPDRKEKIPGKVCLKFSGRSPAVKFTGRHYTDRYDGMDLT